MKTSRDERTILLQNLCGFTVPVGTTLGELTEMPWESSKELVTLRAGQVKSVLQRYLAGELSGDDLEAWANGIEGREDIAFDPVWCETIADIIFDLANTELQGDLTFERAVGMLSRISTGHSVGQSAE